MSMSNLQRLTVEYAAKLMLDRAGNAGGEFGRTAAVAVRMMESGALTQDMNDAKVWVDGAMQAVRAAPDYAGETDEEIARAILKRLKEKRSK